MSKRTKRNGTRNRQAKQAARRFGQSPLCINQRRGSYTATDAAFAELDRINRKAA